MTELLAILGACGYLTAIGLAIYALHLRGRLGDLRFDLADRDRTIANAATEIMVSAKTVALRDDQLARCREQKGDVHEALATAGTPGGDVAVDDTMRRMYPDSDDPDPGGHRDR